MRYSVVLVLVLIFFSVEKTYAALQITEVMYSPEKGGEWIEIYNDGNSPVDLKGYKLFDGVNHTISATSLILPAGSYMILANDKSDFVSAYNNVLSQVVDIVTSLNNNGDTVIIRNASNVDLVQMTYQANAGADKNEKSLQKIDGEFLPFKPPSPGEPTQVTKNDVDEQLATETAGGSSSATANTVQNSGQTSPYHAWPSDMQIYVSAGEDMLALAGARVTFEGKVLSAARKTLPNADLIWTFGDGGSDRGTKVYHTFHYPGKYVVILDVISGDYIAKDELFVDVVVPKLSVLNVLPGEKGYVEIKNNSIHNLDIGEYVIESGGLTGTHFKIPKNTILLSGRSIIFPNQITRLRTETNNVSLKFQDGEVITAYGKDGESQKEEIVLENRVVTEDTREAVDETTGASFVSQSVQDFSKKIIASVFGSVQKNTPVTATSSLESPLVGDSAPLEDGGITQAAAVGVSPTVPSSSLYSLGVLILGAVVFVLVLRKYDTHTQKSRSIDEEAEEIEIIQ
jgi:hypothetical protein